MTLQEALEYAVEIGEPESSKELPIEEELAAAGYSLLETCYIKMDLSDLRGFDPEDWAPPVIALLGRSAQIELNGIDIKTLNWSGIDASN